MNFKFLNIHCLQVSSSFLQSPTLEFPQISLIALKTNCFIYFKNFFFNKSRLSVGTYDLNQGCPTIGPLKILMRPREYFQFSGNNESYEDEFCEIAEAYLGRKSTNKSEIRAEDLFF